MAKIQKLKLLFTYIQIKYCKKRMCETLVTFIKLNEKKTFLHLSFAEITLIEELDSRKPSGSILINFTKTNDLKLIKKYILYLHIVYNCKCNHYTRQKCAIFHR